ncbi:myosin-2 heavy chain-like [Macrobrachium rosenbergii]|uniref:myosin-2 heavy chain-like n=1 Tax=Macrobrachium rosenbergii TaxID=79674 RepID=UPI0034D77C78
MKTMSSFYKLLCALFGLVASCKPATRIVEEINSYYTVIPGSDFDLDIVLTKIPKQKPALDFGWTAGVTAAFGTCCVVAASVGLFAFNKYGNLKKCLERMEHDLEKQKDDAVAETTKLRELLDRREIMIQEAEERRKDLADEYEAQIEKRNDMINELEIEKQDMNERLESAFHHGKEVETFLEESRAREHGMKSSLRSLKEKLQHGDRKIEDLLNVERTIRLEQKELKEKHEKEIDKLLEDRMWLEKKESENRQELQHLIEECEMWKEKCKIQEEITLTEQKRARDQRRIKEETLRNQDKYMLMALLHGIAERNFHLEHIALECGNENQQNVTEKENQEKERAQDLFDHMQKTKAEQYDRAQQERNDYLKQWGDLTQVLQDVMYEDESLPELRHGISGRNSEIDKICDQSPEDQRHKNTPTRKEVQILKARIAQLEDENLVLMEYLEGTLQQEFDEVFSHLEEAKDRLKDAEEKALERQGKLREAEYKLTEKNALSEDLDRRAVLKSEADRCIDNQDFDSALALLRFIVKYYGNEVECRVKEVRCLLALARIEEAQDVLDELPKEFKETCLVKIESALLSACNLEFEKSRLLLSQVLDVCPNHPRVLIAQDFVQQRMLWEALPGMIDATDFDGALENIALAMSLGCLYPWVSVDLARITGNIFCRLGKLKEASECFLNALAVDEYLENCRLRLSLCFLLLGRYTDAIAQLTKLGEENEMAEYLISLAEYLERMQQYGCPYKVLGVERDVAQDGIRKAYRRTALKYHPDKNQEADKETAHLIMLQINYANDLLSNAKSRKRYDKTRKAIEEYAAEIFENPNLPEWLEYEEADESESNWDSEYDSDSADEYESDSESDADVVGNSVLMECSYNDYLDSESNVDNLEEEDGDSYEELEDEEDDDSYEELEDEDDDDSYEELEDEDEEYTEKSDEEGNNYSGDDFHDDSSEESQDEWDNDSLEESDDGSNDESNEET